MAANGLLSVSDFTKMFNYNEASGKFSTDLDSTHGKLTMGADGKLKNVGRYDRGKTNYHELETASKTAQTTDDFKVRAALVKALMRDGVDGNSDFLEGIRTKLGIAGADLNDANATATPLSRRTVKEVLVDLQQYKAERLARVSDANRQLAARFAWEDPSQRESFFSQLMHTGGGRPVVDLFGTGPDHTGRKAILDAVRDMAQTITSDIQKRIFLAYVFSERGASTLRLNYDSRGGVTDSVKKQLEPFKQSAGAFPAQMSRDRLDAWCAFLATDEERPTLTEGDVQFVDTALTKLADKMSKLKNKKALSPGDIKELSAILIPPKASDHWDYVQYAITRVACGCGILSPEMRHGILANKNVDKTIDSMLKEFETSANDALNVSIIKLFADSSDDVNEWCEKHKNNSSIQAEVKKIEDRASEHLRGLRAIASLLYGVDSKITDESRGYPGWDELTNGLSIENGQPKYCQAHFKKRVDAGKPLYGSYQMSQLCGSKTQIILAAVSNRS